MEYGQGLSLKSLELLNPNIGKRSRTTVDCAASSVLDRVNRLHCHTHKHKHKHIECQIIYSSLHYHSFSFKHLYTCVDLRALMFTPLKTCQPSDLPVSKGYCCWESDEWEWRYFWRPCFQPNRFSWILQARLFWVAREVFAWKSCGEGPD